MQKRRLGTTAIEITPLGLGCWQLAQGSSAMARAWDPVTQADAAAIVEAALAGGISWFDTAEIYGGGTSEKALAAALSSLGVKAGSVTIATKWWPLARRARSIESTIDTRLACLAPYPIDLHQVHQPLSISTVPAQMKAMARVLKAGKIRAVGVSNFSARAMEQAHAALAAEGIALASNQVRFNLLDRRIEKNGILAAAKRLGVTIIAWSPLAQGILTGRFHEDPSAVRRVSPMRRMMNGMGAVALTRTAPLIHALREVARAHGVTPAQAALAWTVSFHGDTVVAIPGATRVSQAQQGAAALGVTLTAAELARIDEASRAAAR